MGASPSSIPTVDPRRCIKTVICGNDVIIETTGARNRTYRKHTDFFKSSYFSDVFYTRGGRVLSMIDRANVNFRQDVRQKRRSSCRTRNEFLRKKPTGRSRSLRIELDLNPIRDGNVNRLHVQTESMSADGYTKKKQPQELVAPPRKNVKTARVFVSSNVESQSACISSTDSSPVAPPRRIKSAKPTSNSDSSCETDNITVSKVEPFQAQPVDTVNSVCSGFSQNHPDVVQSVSLVKAWRADDGRVVTKSDEFVDLDLSRTPTNQGLSNTMDILNGLQCFDVNIANTNYCESDEIDDFNIEDNYCTKNIESAVSKASTSTKVAFSGHMIALSEREDSTSKFKKVSFSIKPPMIVNKPKAGSFPTPSTTKKVPLISGGRFVRQEKAQIGKGSATSQLRMPREFPHFSKILSIPAENALILEEDVDVGCSQRYEHTNVGSDNGHDHSESIALNVLKSACQDKDTDDSDKAMDTTTEEQGKDVHPPEEFNSVSKETPRGRSVTVPSDQINGHETNARDDGKPKLSFNNSGDFPIDELKQSNNNKRGHFNETGRTDVKVVQNSIAGNEHMLEILDSNCSLPEEEEEDPSLLDIIRKSLGYDKSMKRLGGYCKDIRTTFGNETSEAMIHKAGINEEYVGASAAPADALAPSAIAKMSSKRAASELSAMQTATHVTATPQSSPPGTSPKTTASEIAALLTATKRIIPETTASRSSTPITTQIIVASEAAPQQAAISGTIHIPEASRSTFAGVDSKVDTRLTRLPKALLPKPFQKISYKPVRPSYYVISKNIPHTNNQAPNSFSLDALITRKITVSSEDCNETENAMNDRPKYADYMKQSSDFSYVEDSNNNNENNQRNKIALVERPPGQKEVILEEIETKNPVNLKESRYTAIPDVGDGVKKTKTTLDLIITSKVKTSKQMDKFETPKQIVKFETSKRLNKLEASKQIVKFETSNRMNRFEASKQIEKFETSKKIEKFETSKQKNKFEIFKLDQSQALKQIDKSETSKQIDQSQASKQIDKFEIFPKIDQSEASKQKETFDASKQIDKCEPSVEDNLEVCSVESLRSRMNAILEKIHQSERSRFSKAKLISSGSNRVRPIIDLSKRYFSNESQEKTVQQ